MSDLIETYLHLLQEVNDDVVYDTYNSLDVDKNKSLKKQLRTMTLSGKVENSAMKQYLADMRVLGDDALKDDKIVVARVGEQLVGWSYLSRISNSRFDTGVYVKNAYRNLGIGSKLVQMAKNAAGATHVQSMPYDKKTATFFKKNDLLDKHDAERYKIK